MISLIYYLPFEEYESMFDENYNLILVKVTPESTHPYTMIQSKYAHEFLISADYALYLLELGKPEYIKKAIKILEVCINAKTPNNLFLPYFYEELNMTNPNTDCFLNETTRLIFLYCQVIEQFSQLLPFSLIKKLENFCIQNAFLIIQQYSKTVSTFIALCEIYICTFLGKRYSNIEFSNYASQKLSLLYFNIMEHRAFSDYRPIESGQCLGNFLQVIYDITTDSKNLGYISELIYIYWESIAKAFHYKTGNICGPHSRSRGNFLPDVFKEYIDCATNHLTKLSKKKTIDFPARCPSDLLPFFSGNIFVDFSQSLISSGFAYPNYTYSIVASTYMQPDYCLGSFSRNEFWYTRHPLLGYFGNKENPYSLRVTFIHDDHDFSSGALHSVQYHGVILGHVTIQTNRGDKHMDIDSQGKKLKAKELLLRFEISGNISELQISHYKNQLNIGFENINITYSVPYCVFDANSIRFKVTEHHEQLYFDAILYSGTEKTFDLEKTTELISCFVLNITAGKRAITSQSHSRSGNLLISEITTLEHTLCLQTPIKPSEVQLVTTCDKQLLDGVLLENVAQINTARIQNFSLIEKTNVYPPSPSQSHTKILNEIEQIKISDITSLAKSVHDIFSEMNEMNLNISILRRYAMHISINILENVYKKNIYLTLQIEYHNINQYQKISDAATSAQLETIILKTIKKLNADLKNYKERSYDAKLIDKILKIIHEHYLEYNFSLKSISDELGVSCAYISRYFKSTMGSKFIDYINNLKISYAKDILKRENISIKELSARLGYSNSTSFMRMFKNYTGITVRQYITETGMRTNV